MNTVTNVCGELRSFWVDFVCPDYFYFHQQSPRRGESVHCHSSRTEAGRIKSRILHFTTRKLAAHCVREIANSNVREIVSAHVSQVSGLALSPKLSTRPPYYLSSVVMGWGWIHWPEILHYGRQCVRDMNTVSTKIIDRGEIITVYFR